MRIQLKFQNQRAYALVMTLLFLTVGLVLLSGISRWASSSALTTARNNLFNSTTAAAEAATEVVIAQMNRDFLRQTLSKDPSVYVGVQPSTFIANGWPNNYRFSDGKGHANQTDVVLKGWQASTNLTGAFKGLYGKIDTFEITSNARKITGPYQVASGVRQTVKFTSVPLYQYAVFYTLDLEITPGPAMYITGKTHGNADLYIAPGDTLQFMDTVTVVGKLFNSPNPLDPSSRGTPQKPIYSSQPTQVSSMTLPVGTNNDPAAVVQILDIPPAGEDPKSDMGGQRFYNKSDIVITIGNNSVSVKYNENGDGVSFATIPTNKVGGGGFTFINTNLSFFDYRENKQVVGTEIDVRALTNWLTTAGSTIDVLTQSRLKHHINSVYVTDTRNLSGKLTGVRVVNGQFLPPDGLTVATPRPLYVKGNFNAPDLTVGSTNTTLTKPASFASDAITILSGNWNDAWNSSTALDTRLAANTTVNAAFLSGIVQTTGKDGGHYSGGVENYPRFLESWDKQTLTYNGSMVVMFDSRYATGYWINPGTYYRAPIRKWAFDTNFQDGSKLPPNTPSVRYLQRDSWSIVAAAK